jgi:hypothetical protein
MNDMDFEIFLDPIDQTLFHYEKIIENFTYSKIRIIRIING